VLGSPNDAREPTGVARAGVWQAARSLGAHSLLACDVGPGFDFEDFRFVSGIAGHEAHFTGALADFADLL
jgi:predicted cupin superfamily sugar epimerase